MVLRAGISIRDKIFTKEDVTEIKSKLEFLADKDVYKDNTKVGTIYNIFIDYPNRICVNLNIDKKDLGHDQGIEMNIAEMNITKIRTVNIIDKGLLDENDVGTKKGMINWVKIGDN